MRDLLSAIEERMPEPSARGLVNAVTAGIRDGALPAGTRLPPIRTVATQLGLSPTTVSAAWSLLARSGAVETAGRRGTVVTDVRTAGARRYRHALQAREDFSLDLSTGIPDQKLLPDLKRALLALRTTAATPGSYLDEPVLPDLVAAVADDWPYAAQAFTVTDGAMDAIELIARSTIGFGDRVVVEHPVFPPLLDLLESLGTQLVGMPLDGQGPDPHALSDALRVPTAAVVLQPRAQNPTGVSMSSERAEELAAVLADRDTLIIEDDSAGAIATAPALSLGRWLPERTLHVRSYSKSHGPDLRLAVVSGPSDLVDQLTARRQLGQGWSSRLLQHILLYLLTDTRAREQVAAARLAYARRRNAAVNQLREHGLLLGAVDGINLWIPVADEAAALVRLASQGVGVAPGAPFAVLQDHSPHVRVTIGLIDPEREPITELLAQAATRTGGWGRAR